MSAKPETIILAIRALPSNRPIEIRLRWVLKRILRDQQFRCVRISSESPQTPVTGKEKL